MFKNMGKIITTSLVVMANVFLGKSIYDGYNLSRELSPFEKASYKLGFNTQQQEALLGIFNIAGYLQPSNLWYVINKMGFNDKKKLFEFILADTLRSKANKEDIEAFNPKLLRKNLFKSTSINEEDAASFLLYIGQIAFDRKQNVELNELQSKNWMTKHEKDYIEYARVLSLIGKIEPKFPYYDEAWIAGASRLGVLARLAGYNYNLKEIKIKGVTLLLAGQRPLWVEIDGIEPKIKYSLEEIIQKGLDVGSINLKLQHAHTLQARKEGEEYMLKLAQKSHIALNPNAPMIKYQKDDNIPQGFIPGRTYPNYVDLKKPILTETLMCQDLWTKYFANQKVGIIDSGAANGSTRPNTASTVRAATEAIIAKILNGDYKGQSKFTIYFQSSQPYVERQKLVTQREVDKVLTDQGINVEVKIDAVGFANNQEVRILHSELGALIYEKYLNAKIHSNYDIKNLQYSTRDNGDITTPLPDVAINPYSYDVTEFFKDFFDKVL